jgi:hypothetical protein
MHAGKMRECATRQFRLNLKWTRDIIHVKSICLQKKFPMINNVWYFNANNCQFDLCLFFTDPQSLTVDPHFSCSCHSYLATYMYTGSDLFKRTLKALVHDFRTLYCVSQNNLGEMSIIARSCQILTVDLACRLIIIAIIFTFSNLPTSCISWLYFEMKILWKSL